MRRPRRKERQSKHQPHAIEKDLHAYCDCNRSRRSHTSSHTSRRA
jgi:hypothetical protein